MKINFSAKPFENFWIWPELKLFPVKQRTILQKKVFQKQTKNIFRFFFIHSFTGVWGKSEKFYCRILKNFFFNIVHCFTGNNFSSGHIQKFSNGFAEKLIFIFYVSALFTSTHYP